MTLQDSIPQDASNPFGRHTVFDLVHGMDVDLGNLPRAAKCFYYVHVWGFARTA